MRVADDLLVVLGAGASFGCGADDTDAPPLTKHLFQRPNYDEFMREYPLVLDSEPDITYALAGAVIGLETYLRTEMRDADDERSRKRYRQIPLYLQHLLWRKSYSALPKASAYRRLVNQTLKLDRVDFVTLNYDTVLDELLRQQAVDQRIFDLSWYTPGEDNWSLIKLHGSCNWGRRVNHEFPGGGSDTLIEFYEEVFAASSQPLSDQITFMTHHDPKWRRDPSTAISLDRPDRWILRLLPGAVGPAWPGR